MRKIKRSKSVWVVICSSEVLNLDWLEQNLYPDITEEEQEICEEAMKDALWDEFVAIFPNLEKIRFIPVSQWNTEEAIHHYREEAYWAEYEDEDHELDSIFEAMEQGAVKAIQLHRIRPVTPEEIAMWGLTIREEDLPIYADWLADREDSREALVRELLPRPVFVPEPKPVEVLEPVAKPEPVQVSVEGEK